MKIEVRMRGQIELIHFSRFFLLHALIQPIGNVILFFIIIFHSLEACVCFVQCVV